jgi:hypothetical protein
MTNQTNSRWKFNLKNSEKNKNGNFLTFMHIEKFIMIIKEGLNRTFPKKYTTYPA